MTELIQALSRLAGNRHSDGTSSIVSQEDRTIIINGCYDLMIAARQTPVQRVVPADLTNEQKEVTLLRIIDAMGGKTDVSDSSWAWINWFSSDEVHDRHSDTYNRCIEKGWLDYSHDGDFDTSTAWLTKEGRTVLAAVEVDG
ncbi:hypothetical protein AS026_21035 [Rhizobium altiplani]|uniref:Uncharacterized protein n=1 Tax=Rhizobium altiplani TaxID=1864509 RepID=A0A109J4D2_9HYPH|nr:hypothetical protein [Rhizobium altiplani]KWV42098.1 hypothetical protein AS026_21035 [Rhizobium altiplani]